MKRKSKSVESVAAELVEQRGSSRIAARGVRSKLESRALPLHKK